ncbi:MAG: 2-succinyl-5-enolpyruvyl-6-hydroxy-3-cyclohexene-1-carboxylic-acid synthase [Candidatus Hydrogenedentes bacterium]|nr:2-succinyl-5-enolpyruvyl-6-hydroxy-3-cyclohexene-1-carboxylic-acid synthase [Candidatus Hydrogenedentota bacterium]
MTKKPDSVLKNPPNFNMLWGALAVEELIRNGVDNFFISPGSRSTPVTWAVAENPKAKSVVHYDERAAAYAALGVAKSTGRPAAVVCTSGTAAANFFPAVVEAAMSFIPLILITADRPHELSDAGANQTIDQLNIFGKYARWFINLPCPNPQMPGKTVLTAVDHAVYRASNPPAGPVHINMMFREPLAPVDTGEFVREATVPLAQWDSSGRPHTVYELSEPAPSPQTIDRLVAIIRDAARGLLVVGQTASLNEAAAILKLARSLNWPVFPDITSGLRLGPDAPPFVHYYDQLLFSDSFRDFCRPDVVIQIGSPYVSARLQGHLLAAKPGHYVIVAKHTHRHDPTHLVTTRVQSAIPPFCQTLTAALGDGCDRHENPAWLDPILQWNAQCRNALGDFLVNCGAGVPPARINEPAIAWMLPSLAPHDATIFLASSMPIRDADMYAKPSPNPVFATANRGASGIDGLVATAAGYAHGARKPVILLLGDIAMLHDLNSLALLSKVHSPVIVVVINNFGGAIFSFLPIAAFPLHFEKFWAAPHSLTFKHAAEMFSLPYANPATLPEFAAALKTAAQSNSPALIEIHTDRDQNIKIHRAIQEHMRKTLDASCTSPS